VDKERTERANLSLQRKIGLGAMSLAGLLLAIGGTTAAVSGVEDLRRRLTLDLPDWVWLPFIVLLSVEAAFLAYLLVPGLLARRLRREGRRSMTSGMWLLLILAAAYLFAPRSDIAINFLQLLSGAVKATGPASADALADAQPPVLSALTSGIMEALLLALACMGFGVLAWLYNGIRERQDQGMPNPPAPSALQTAVEESLDDLRHLADVRLAIIKCYGRFERVLAVANVHRAPWQTAMEFMRTALQCPGLPQEAVRELTSLFELARFSRHELGPDDRERAWQALMAARDALDREAVDAPAG
jgi:hypothetical protein